MRASTRYSMRLRSRGANANDAAAASDADNNESVATTATAARTALGNISNRECNADAAGDEKLKPSRSKPSGAAERRGRSSSKPKEEEPRPLEPQKRPTARRSSSRRAPAAAAAAKSASATSKKVKSKRKPAPRGEPARKKAPAAKRAQPSKKDAKAKRGSGSKRTSAGGENGARAQQRGRSAKRARTSTEASAGGAARSASGRRVQKSRPRSSSSMAMARKKSVRKRVVPVEVMPAPGGGRLVPADFGLRRSSLDGLSFTYGIAHYDAPDRSDPLRCKDYVTDMFQHLYQVETDARPKPYMDDQEDINEKMRAILVDWLVEVHMKFRLVPETLYLCVHIIDRYCAVAHVQRTKLQLVGVTALFLACKHEEIYPPEVRDCVYITDRAYDRQEVLDMEQTILSVLDWKISLPTAYPFLDRFLCLTDASPMTRHAATYYLERTLQEHELLEYRPSLVCASAVILALNNPDIRIHEDEYDRDLPGLPNILMEYTEFDKNDLMSCMTIVAAKICEPAICASRRHLTAVRKKYEHRKYLSVSSVLDHPSIQFVKENMSPAD